MPESDGHTLGADILFLEDKMGLLINARRFRKKFDYLRERDSQLSREANRLLERLSDIQGKEPLFRYGFETTGLTNSLKNVWRAKSEWLQDYENFLSNCPLSCY